MTEQEVFNADLDRFNAAFQKAGAVGVLADGFQYVDEEMLPRELVNSYRRLVTYGFARGLL